MKNKVLLFLYFLSIFGCFGQNIEPKDLNFKLDENKKIIWEKNYDYEANKDSLTVILQVFLKNNPFTSELNLTDNGFYGESNKVLLSSTKHMAIGARNPFNAIIKIDIMDGNYVVTVTEIVFDGIEFNYPMIGEKSAGPPELPLEDFVVKNKKPEFRSNKGAMSQLSILNKDLDHYFTIKKVD